MRILLVTPYYPIVNRSDLFFDTKAMHYFAKQWVKDGNDVTVIHMYFHTFPMFRLDKYKSHFGHRIEEDTLDSVRILRMENRVFFSLKKFANHQLRRAARRFNRYLRDADAPDVLTVHSPCLYAEFVKHFDVSCARIGVLHQSDIKAFEENRIEAHSLYSYYNAIGYRSLSIKREFERRLKIDKHTFMVYSGAPLPEEHKAFKRFSTDKPLNILFVGKLIKLKKISIILKALASFTGKLEYSFTIVGEGAEETALRQMSEELELSQSITFTGVLTREQVFEKMHESDVFVMVSSPETFGLVYIEAMSQGCITIGSKGEGIDGIIKDGQNGFLIEPGNVGELQLCLETIGEMTSEKLIEMSKKAIKTAQEMTEEKMAKRYLDNIKTIVNRR